MASSGFEPLIRMSKTRALNRPWRWGNGQSVQRSQNSISYSARLSQFQWRSPLHHALLWKFSALLVFHFQEIIIIALLKNSLSHEKRLTHTRHRVMGFLSLWGLNFAYVDQCRKKMGITATMYFHRNLYIQDRIEKSLFYFLKFFKIHNP